MSESSLDDDSDTSVQPSKWGKDRYLPAQGPSKARIAAQQIIGAQRQKEAAKALISLFHTNMTTSDNSDDSSSGASHTSQSTPCASVDNQRNLPVGNNEESKETPVQPVVPNNTTVNVDAETIKPSTSDQSDDNIPLSQLCERYEDDVPLSVLCDQLKPKGKPYFKTTTYELVKYKCSRVFKYIQCAHMETSQKRINNHFPEHHELLSCSTCGKMCITVSALKKHAYEHTDIS